MHTIDIIIPVFNASSVLPKCIESVVRQSYRDFHLFIIDDGSTDDSVEKALSYSRSDSRIEVVSKPNAGVSSARNKGLELSTARWVMFLDADDYLEQNALAELLPGDDDNVDLCVANYRMHNGRAVKDVVFPRGKVLREDLYRLYRDYDFQWSSSVWGKLFRREVIADGGLTFNAAMHHSEDLVFLNQFLLHCRTVFFSGQIGYHYILGNTSSLTRTFHSFDTEMTGVRAVEKAAKDLIRFCNVNDVSVIGKMMQPVVFCQFRALNSIYGAELKKGAGRKERISMIKDVGIDRYKAYIYPVEGWKERFLNTILLKLGWIRLYDAIRYFSAGR